MSTVSREEGQELTGTVKWFDSTKGFGFIICDDGGEDLFAHHTQIKGEETAKALYEGQKVKCTFHEEDGKVKAQNITGPDGEAVKKVHSSLTTPGVSKRLKANPLIKLGSIKWFDGSKGFGFIVADDGSEELFVHQSEIKSNGPLAGGIEAGTEVEYQVNTEEESTGSNKKAKEVTAVGGRALQGKGAAGGGGVPVLAGYGYPGVAMAPMGAMGGMGGLGAPMPQMAPMATLPRAAPTHTVTMAPSGGKKAGTVKWYNPAKGFGFLIPNDGSEELFMHTSSIYTTSPELQLEAGTPVEYSIEVKNGQNRAGSVSGLGGAPLGGGAQAYGGLGKRKPADLSADPYGRVKRQGTAELGLGSNPYAMQSQYGAPQAAGYGAPAAAYGAAPAAPAYGGYQQYY